MFNATATAIILIFNANSPLFETIVLHNKIWKLSLSAMRDMQKEEFWKQKSKTILYTRISILKYTRPNGSSHLLLNHISLYNNDPNIKDIVEHRYPVYGILLHYGASIVDDIFVHVSDLNKEDQATKDMTIKLCHMLLLNIYRHEVDGKSILKNRIQKEINSRPQDKRETLKALLKKAEQ